MNQNRNVNLNNQIQKERNAQYVIFRSYGLDQGINLKLAVNNHFLSVFYLQVFTFVLNSWLGIGFAAAISAYRSYGKLNKKSMGFTGNMIRFLFLILNNFDQYKDIQYVVFLPHSWIYTVLFSLTLTIPVILNILSNQSLTALLRNKKFDERGRKHPDFGFPLEVNEFWFYIE